MAQVGYGTARKRLGLRAPKAVAAAGIAALAALGIVGALRMQSPPLQIASASPSLDAHIADEPILEPAHAVEEPLLSSCVVHVDGAVKSPGVYTLSGDIVRVCDAVDAAGGLADDADTASVNLAQPISDGSKVHIPLVGERDAELESFGDATSGLVNINSADADALMELPGVGEQTARAILESREKLGPFSSVDDLLRVNGIGEKKLEKIKPYACV